MYKIMENNILHISECRYIPISENNPHYKEYLKWLEAGGIPEQEEREDSLKLFINGLSNTVSNYYDRIITTLTDAPSQTEKDTWAMKSKLALDILLLDKKQIKTLDTTQEQFLSTAEIINRKEWAGKVISKSNNYSTILGLAEKFKSDNKKLILEITDVESAKDFMSSLDIQFKNVLAKLGK